MNSNGKKKVSLAIWIPWIWYAIACSRSVSRWLSLEGSGLTGGNYLGGDPLSGNPIDRGVYSVLMFIGILILLKRRIDWREILKDNTWVGVLFFYMLLSILWSDFGGIAFKRWIRASGDVVMALVVLTESSPLEAIATLLRRCFIIHLPLSIILIKYFRAIGVGWDDKGLEMWQGVAIHKNELGQVAMVSGVYFIWSMMRTRSVKRLLFDIPFLLMALWLLKGSGSSFSGTSIFGFFFGIGTLVIFHFARLYTDNVKKYLIIAILFVGVCVSILQLTLAAFTEKSLLSVTVEGSGRDTTLTGRTELWDDILEMGSLHPVLGVGYGSFWIGNIANNLWEKHIWRPNQGHNGYIDVYVELGWVGIFVLMALIIFAYKRIMGSVSFDSAYGSF